jgi:redox-sensitive bicupin YhaK (pirin superfamily)
MSTPGYQGITADNITDVTLANDVGIARIIAGVFDNVKGAAHTYTPMNVWDMRLNAGKALSLDLPAGHTTALYVLSGALKIGEHLISRAEMAVMEREGTALVADVTKDAVVLLLSGEPLNEPIAGHGPFVMNTRAEITQAMQDYNNGKFGQIMSA